MSTPPDQLKRYGESIAGAVTPARSRVAAMEAIGKVAREQGADVARRRRSLGWKLQVTGAALGALVIVNVGAAGVANAAVPGDALYGLDRAYESVVDWFGAGSDRVPERLSEAEVLLERANPGAALDLLATEMPEDDVRQAARLLLSADLDESTLTAHTNTLLGGVQVLAAADGDTRVRQEGLAAVRLLAAQVSDDAVSERGSSADAPSRQQGSPDHAAETGPPDHAEETGSPNHAGPPATTGNDGNNGSPSGQPDQAGEQGPPDQAAEPRGSGSGQEPGGPPATSPDPPADGTDQSSPDQGGDSGPPDQAGNQGPPDHAGDQGPPDHAGETGPPDHAGQPGPPSGGGSSGDGASGAPPGGPNPPNDPGNRP